jgi:hypothetical protein
MSKRRIIGLGAVVAIAAALTVLVAMTHRLGSSKQAIAARTYQIGQDLISRGTSTQLAGLPPGLPGQLSNLRSSPTTVAAVLLGDEPPPVGDGSACSRLILTNQLAKGLELRLCPAFTGDKLRILGYWPTSINPGLR